MTHTHPSAHTGDVAGLRRLAQEGRLAEFARTATSRQRAALSGAAFTLAWPIVFNGLTRGYEQRRGHWTCAAGVNRLADTCLDRFYDDVEAVVEDLLTQATTKILNAEGWITMRLRAATVDAHRRRRGARGALQRPRMPGWLATALNHDPWLIELALEILVWVGVPTTAGTQIWPLDAWAEKRSLTTGAVYDSDTRTVLREVTRVLTAMRGRPQWYADYVERPLGAKIPPLAPARADRTTVMDPPALILTPPHEMEDLRLADLASLALSAVEAQLALDPDDEPALGRIITTVFGGMDFAGDAAKPPGEVGDHIDRLAALSSDQEELHRLVRTVREIVAGGRPGG